MDHAWIVNVVMKINLSPYQEEAVNLLMPGKILVGGVGSGKSRTALYYFFSKECGGKIETNGIGKYEEMKTPKDLYIITTAKKRDTGDWIKEAVPFLLERYINVKVDSWNNISKYTKIKNAFFIFDEQRVIGNGTWVKSFLVITKNNNWILLSATPGDTWMEYVPVFIANNFYKNRTEFISRHVIYKWPLKYQKVDRYIDERKLIFFRDLITVNMNYNKHTLDHKEYLMVPYDKKIFDVALVSRWNVYKKEPIKNVSELCYVLRRIVNSDPRRIEYVKQLLDKHKKIIVFYNFNYERKLLLELAEKLNVFCSEWSGHKHEEIPNKNNWIYIVQYTAGAEGWECTDTNVIVFYSQNYSYKITTQAAGRIDRLNTPFKDLYYYYLISTSLIDTAIKKAFNNKKNFNEKGFLLT